MNKLPKPDENRIIILAYNEEKLKSLNDKGVIKILEDLSSPIGTGVKKI